MSNLRDSQFHTSGQWTFVAPNMKGVIKNTGYGSFVAVVHELNGKSVSLSYGPSSSRDAVEVLLRQRATGDLRITEVSTKISSLPVKGDSDDTILENMRVDSKVSDQSYVFACMQFKQKPKARPNFSAGGPIVTVVENPYSPMEQSQIFAGLFRNFCDSNWFVAVPNRPDLQELNEDKMLLHLIEDGYSVPNDQDGMTPGKTVTHAVLIEALRDLRAMTMLHDSDSGKRGVKRVVQPYSRQAILEMRSANSTLHPQELVFEPQHPAQVNRGVQQDRIQIEKTVIAETKRLFPHLEPESGEFRAQVDARLKQLANIPTRNMKVAGPPEKRTHI